jgi:plasmid segregation protein ParM
MNAAASGVIAIDDGGSSTCIATKNNEEMFYSVKGLYGDRTLTTSNGKHDFIVSYKGEKYVMGTLAKYDCAMPLQLHSKSKQHLFFDLSTLVAIHQYGYASNYLICSVPIKMHTEDEKNGRIIRLKKSHTITVNDITRTFSITDVKVAPESAVVYWLKEPQEQTRWLDLGSRTIGYATTVVDEEGVTRFIDTESGTLFGKGLEALDEQYNAKGLADYIYGRLIKVWGINDKIYLFGGGALDETLVECIKRYFPNAEVIDNPQMANARAMYRLGCFSFGMA